MKLSIRHKIVILIVLLITVLSVSLLTLTSRYLSSSIDEQFRTRAQDVSETVAATVDARVVEHIYNLTYDTLNGSDDYVTSDDWGSEEFNAHLARFSFVTKTQEYQRCLSFLRKIQDVNDVECIYIAGVDPKKEVFFYVVDAAYEDQCMPGVLDPVYETNRILFTKPEVGFPPYITDTPEYGWLVTSGSPIYSSDKRVVGYAMCDISMNEVRRAQAANIRQLIFAVLLFAFFTGVIAVAAVNRNLLIPIRKLNDATRAFQQEKSLESHVFENLDIHTGDELEELADSMAQMEKNLNTQIVNLVEVSDELNVTQNLAVRDALTGIRNKRGYDREKTRLEEEIAGGHAEFGLAMIDLNFLKKINDEFGHEKGDIALQNVSRLICDIFVHSPVFRIGGDEFIVVLQQNDLHKREELVRQFEEAIEESSSDPNLKPWERVNASLGIAVYDPAIDTSVEDVFHRADQAMYNRKLEMKAVR